MFSFVYVITTFVSVFLLILHGLMLMRAVLSWLPVDDEIGAVNFVYSITEPVILPFRLVLERSEFVASLPIDIPFYAAFLSIGIVQMLLPAVI